ncbi:DUF3289 family protein [Siccibacter turicensis]|uniref:DUF3289 family protein n=1 Tax=Siccibacter turicensis TaxID=357233 RepID=UPI0010228B79|nr:DUF3289 family protein [Siccibacter turicensis]
MAEAARKDDIASGHGCFPDTAITEGSPNVFINGQPAARVGDAVAPHGCTCGNGCGTHSRVIAEGASSVFINGKPAVAVGHSINCGGVVISGSSNVFIDSEENSASDDASEQPWMFVSDKGAVQHSFPEATSPGFSDGVPAAGQQAQATQPEPMPLPVLIYQTTRQMDDYQAKDMHHGDLDALTLRNQLNLDVDTVSARVNARTLRLLNQPNPYIMTSPYAIAAIPDTMPEVSREKAVALMFDEFRELAKLFSFHGEYQHIITEMITHMQGNSGTTYSSPLLDQALKEQIMNDHSEQSSLLLIRDILTPVIDYEYGFIPLDKKEKLFDEKGNFKDLSKAVLPKFNRLIDQANGLVISVHDTWATHITLKSLEVTGDSFRAKVHYRIQDHFGLDETDVMNPLYREFRIFRLWFALQRWDQYGYKPFITEMNATVEISGGTG